MSESTNIDSTAHFPACFVELPAYTEFRRAPFYLAAEEYIARELPVDNYLFSWQLRPTVVMGRNQVAHQEINIDFCHSEGIDIVRRKSGGGAIFADERNIMWSLITGASAVEPLFAEYSKRVAEALSTLGARATVSGRNDIVLEGGGKVCGNAFYHMNDRNIVHGTMLFDTDPYRMQHALTPDVSKLEMKGVKSVRSRVSLLKDLLPFGVEELRLRLRPLLSDRCITLSDADVKAIEAIEQSYYAPDYLFQRQAHSDVTLSRRIAGCGSITLQFSLSGSQISDVTVAGDYFELEDAHAAFSTAFKGVTFTPASLEEAVRRAHPERSIRSLSAEQLIALCRS